MMDVDSANEEVDPLASSGMSISSYEDGGMGKTRKKSKSTLSRLRKLKKPEANGPIGNFTPHPPSDKSAWNSPRTDGQSPTIPNGITHSPEEIDPFTGEIKKSRKKKDLFTSAGDEDPSPGKDDDDSEEKVDPFTGQVIRTKKKRDPFTMDASVDFEGEPIKEDETDGKVDPFTGAQVRTRKDPFTGMNSVDFDKPNESVPHEIQRTSKEKQRDRFTAMNSTDFSSVNDDKDEHVPGHDRTTSRQRDRFTAMNSIDFNSPTNDENTVNGDEYTNTIQSSISLKNEKTFDSASELSINTKNTNGHSHVSDGQINIADDETGEQDGEIKERRLTPDGADSIEGVITAEQESKVESSLNLSDGNDLLKSSSTDSYAIKSSLPPLSRQRRLSPLQEHSSQEQSSPERQKPPEYQSNKNISNISPLLNRKIVDEYGESIGEREERRVDVVKDGKDCDEDGRTEINTTETEIVTNKEQAVDIEEDSDSDDLVVIPGLNKKPSDVVINSKPNTEMEVAAATNNELLPVATSTPSKLDGVSSISGATPVVPVLDLEGVVRSDEEQDEVMAEYRKHVAKSIDSGNEDEDNASGSGSELEETTTLKASNWVAHNSGDSESEIIVRRKSRTKNIPDIIACPDESGGESSSNVTKTGKLSPILSKKQPPPLEENFSSLVLRTCYRKDNLASSVVLSEPVMRSREELSDTNRSFLSTGALPQISTKKARNRSFLSGGMRNTGSLLGRDELERFFPDRKLHIFMATWNMCELKILPDNLEDLLLPEHSEYDIMHDMYVIGTQESSADGFEWEASLQETLGPSHVLLHSATHGVLRLLIFIRRDLIWFCSPVEEDKVSTRAFSMIKTKGAVAASFTFFGTSFLFINAHFTSGDENMNDRLQDYDKICKGLHLPVKVVPTKRFNVLTTDVTTRFDCVFWCGDFNFRLVESRKKVETWANQLHDGTKTDYNILLEHDQLRKSMNKNEIFKGFKEGAIEFIPTYKFDIGDDIYDTSEKKRVPSYTDRILFKSRKKSDVAILDYTSINDIKASDHRPVCGVYQVSIRPGKEDMALGGGQFSREVFIEGNKRRAARAGISDKIHSQKDSSVCSIM
ncbi:uncharacterized protein [Amphiura filiformis]|uniref:uncharacterized protein n=1 Tax=Amphiura filiformis TaxID=82378 RepID=UPI003B22547B